MTKTEVLQEMRKQVDPVDLNEFDSYVVSDVKLNDIYAILISDGDNDIFPYKYNEQQDCNGHYCYDKIISTRIKKG